MRHTTSQWAFEQPIARWAILLSVGFSVWAVTLDPELEPAHWWWIAPMLLLLLSILLWRIKVSVDDDAVRVRMAAVFRANIPVDDIESVEVREYRPLKQFGGWGWRFGANGARQYAFTGKRAVVITRTDGREVYVGARESELQNLADAIDRGRALAPR